MFVVHWWRSCADRKQSGHAGPAESQTPWNVVAGDHARSGPAHTGQPDSEGLHRAGTSTQAPPSCIDDSLAHWKPVQANKNRRDVVVAMSPGDQAGCRVLHRLESPKVNISDPSQKRVAVVQSTAAVRDRNVQEKYMCQKLVLLINNLLPHMTKASSRLSAATGKCVKQPSAAADWGYILTATDGRHRCLENAVCVPTRFIENSVIRQRFLTAHDGNVTTNTSNLSAATEKCIERLSAANTMRRRQSQTAFTSAPFIYPLSVRQTKPAPLAFGRTLI